MSMGEWRKPPIQTCATITIDWRKPSRPLLDDLKWAKGRSIGFEMAYVATLVDNFKNKS